MDWAMFREFGLVGVLIGSILFIKFFIIKWILKFAERIQERAEKQADKFLTIIEGFQKAQEANTQAIMLHTEQAKVFHAQITDSIRRICEDLKAMLAGKS